MGGEKRLVLYCRESDERRLDSLLRNRGFRVYVVHDQQDLLDALKFSHPDAAILGTPRGVDPMCALLTTCAEHRTSLKVVVLPEISTTDRITLLDNGADYVSSGMRVESLAAQLRALLRRFGNYAAPARQIDLGYLCVDLEQKHALVDGEPVHLTPTEFEILRVLAERPGTVLPSGEIMQHVLGSVLPPEEAQDVLKVHMHRLRQKLERGNDRPNLIRSVRGHGYMYAFERRAGERRAQAADASVDRRRSERRLSELGTVDATP